MKSKLTPQKINKALATAAAEALGGVPARPPVPKARNPEAEGLREKREAFATAAAAAEEPKPVPAIGHPTFDATPPEVLARRAKVELVRGKLSSLANLITEWNAELQPLISELAAEEKTVKTAEQFDPAVARKFLADLGHVVTGLAAKPKAKEETPATATTQD